MSDQLQDVLNDVVKKTSIMQDTLTRTEIVESVNDILQSPRFKAMSALDVCSLIIDKIREGSENVTKS